MSFTNLGCHSRPPSEEQKRALAQTQGQPTRKLQNEEGVVPWPRWGVVFLLRVGLEDIRVGNFVLSARCSKEAKPADPTRNSHVPQKPFYRLVGYSITSRPAGKKRGTPNITKQLLRQCTPKSNRRGLEDLGSRTARSQASRA